MGIRGNIEYTEEAPLSHCRYQVLPFPPTPTKVSCFPGYRSYGCFVFFLRDFQFYKMAAAGAGGALSQDLVTKYDLTAKAWFQAARGSGALAEKALFIFFQVGTYLDRHLVFPLLEFLQVQNIYPENEACAL